MRDEFSLRIEKSTWALLTQGTESKFGSPVWVPYRCVWGWYDWTIYPVNLHRWDLFPIFCPEIMFFGTFSFYCIFKNTAEIVYYHFCSTLYGFLSLFPTVQKFDKVLCSLMCFCLIVHGGFNWNDNAEEFLLKYAFGGSKYSSGRGAVASMYVASMKFSRLRTNLKILL